MKGISRRHFCQTSSLLMAGLAPVLRATPDPIRAIQYEAMEWSYTSRKAYADPFNEVELDVVVTHSDGRRATRACVLGGRTELDGSLCASSHGTLQLSHDLQRSIQRRPPWPHRFV